MPRSVLALAIVPGISLLFPGCLTVGPDYAGPDTVVPDAWTQSLSKDLASGRSNIEKWWRYFNDPVLNELIERTRTENRDIRIVAERIREARALRGIAQSQLFPMANASADYVRVRASESLLIPALPKNPSDFYAAGFDAGWEIDVFGGIRRSIESADAGIGASEEAYRDILITLLAEVALNYVEYRTLEERIRLADANIDAQSRSVQLTQDRLSAGLAPKIDVTQAISNLETSRSLIPQLKTQRVFARNRIATLVGGYPGSVTGILGGRRRIPAPGRRVAGGIPADLLRSRPDIRRTERELAAQTALIGVAASDLYPRFALFGDFTLQSASGSDFFDSASRAYSFGPSFRWQIFSAGRIRNNIHIEESRTEQALLNYENTVLRAVEEVETAMASVANERDRHGMLRIAVDASTETVDLVVDNYRNGLVDFQNVLDAQRTKFTTEDEAAVSQGQIARNVVTLYKALGGGSELEVIPVPEPRPRPGLFYKRKTKDAEPESGS